MTRNGSAPQGNYQQRDYGSRFGEIRDEDQSTYPDFTSSCYHFLLHFTEYSQSLFESYLRSPHQPLLDQRLCMEDLLSFSWSLEAPANRGPMSDMNENLNERFGRGKAIRDSHMPRSLTARPSVTLNLSIREYAKTASQPADLSHWLGFREIPSPNEVFDKGRTEHSTTLELTENTVVGPYISKEEYLESHYRLLREDAVAPLRDVVSEVQYFPQLLEKDSDNDAYIYEKVPHEYCTPCGIY